MTQQWSTASTDHDTNITFSGGNLTATSSLAGNWASGKATEQFITGAGRYWFVITMNFGADNRVVVGMGTQSLGPTSTFADGNYIGVSQYGLGYFGDGRVISLTLITTLAAYTSGTPVGIAMDLIVNKVWFQPGVGANFNNDILANQNPAVGSQVGGIPIPSAMLNDAGGGTVGTNTGTFAPAYTCVDTGNTAVGSFAKSSWPIAAPTGFGPFDPVFCIKGALSLVGVGCGIWAANELATAIEDKTPRTRRSLLMPSRGLWKPRRRSLIGHNGGPALDD